MHCLAGWVVFEAAPLTWGFFLVASVCYWGWKFCFTSSAFNPSQAVWWNNMFGVILCFLSRTLSPSLNLPSSSWQLQLSYLMKILFLPAPWKCCSNLIYPHCQRVFVESFRPNELPIHWALMPGEPLYSKIMEHDVQHKTFCSCSCIWYTMGMVWWLRVLICFLWGWDLQDFYQPTFIPNPCRRLVCPRPGMEIFALGLPAECCLKKKKTFSCKIWISPVPENGD